MAAATEQDPTSSSTSTSDVPGPRPLRITGHRGLALAADVWGDPAAPPVILLHGGGQTRHAWGGTAEALARAGWQAVALDLRGHGDSGWAPDRDYSPEAFVADLHACVAHLGRRPALVGASLGGITALLAEGEAPEPICRSLVLVDIAVRIEREGALRIIGFMKAHPEGFASLDAAADVIAAYLPHRKRPRDLSGLARNLRQGPDGRFRWHWDPAFLEPGSGPRPGQDGNRLERAARALRVPTLLVRGQRSDLLSEEGARQFLALAPSARFVDVSDAGHMVAGDRNDAFTEAVVSFLGAP
ncbi:MAG: alpha/beta hydrolase [Deltaproteobacteria bacterium]|nr:alpha/beta hydrolase [Deltaproteobacteria bacterium]